MIKGVKVEIPELPDHLFITNELYCQWQQDSKNIDIQDSVVSAIKALRKSLDALEKRTAISSDIMCQIADGEKLID